MARSPPRVCVSNKARIVSEWKSVGVGNFNSVLPKRHSMHLHSALLYMHCTSRDCDLLMRSTTTLPGWVL